MLVLAFAAAVLVAAAVFYTGWDLLGARGLKPEHRIDSKTLFDLVKLSFGVVAGAGALREATRLHTERFTTAVGQLGHEGVPVVLAEKTNEVAPDLGRFSGAGDSLGQASVSGGGGAGYGDAGVLR
ncbi:hypothetical protein ABT316_17325 [Streptomyces cellulosae]